MDTSPNCFIFCVGQKQYAYLTKDKSFTRNFGTFNEKWLFFLKFSVTHHNFSSKKFDY